eukprot:10587013-Alexandrium_andersonii.AAC.1
MTTPQRDTCVVPWLAPVDGRPGTSVALLGAAARLEPPPGESGGGAPEIPYSNLCTLSSLQRVRRCAA